MIEENIKKSICIPHDKGLPLLGHTLTVVRNPLQFLRQLSNKYDDLVKIRIAGKIFYVIQNPESCRHILQENAKNYFKPGSAKEMKRFLGEGLATSNGEQWLRQRRLMQPGFHRKKIESLVTIINNETTGLIKNWKEQSSPHTENISQVFLNLTLGNITKAMFGTDLGRNLNEIAQVVSKHLEYATDKATSIIKIPHYIPTPANRQFKKANTEFEKIIYSIIEQRKKEYKNTSDSNHDLLDMLLHAFDDESGSYMTARQLRDEITTIFMAGHETTAQTLSWIFYQLAANRSVYEKIKAEADTFATGEITLDTLQNLVYTKNVIEETLRLYPPVWVIARKAIAGDTFNRAVSIPGGATVLLNIYGMHHQAANFSSPEVFNPGHFHTDNKVHHPFAYLPFGGGQRTCIGKQFAMMVMQTVVCRLVREFEFEVPRGFIPVVVPGITLRAKGGIHLIIKNNLSS